MSAKFNKAVELVNTLPKDGPIKPSDQDKLDFYGLYKQATVGDVNTSRPGMLDFVGKAKWDAWKSREGVSKEEAETKYVEVFLALLKKHESDEAKAAQAQLESA